MSVLQQAGFTGQMPILRYDWMQDGFALQACPAQTQDTLRGQSLCLKLYYHKEK